MISAETLPCGKVVDVDIFAWLLDRLGLGSPKARARQARGRRATPARRRPKSANRAITLVESSVTTTRLPSGKSKRRKTQEWRHGDCPVRHRSKQAAVRCRNS